jgi:hypothetical protein
VARGKARFGFEGLLELLRGNGGGVFLGRAAFAEERVAIGGLHGGPAFAFADDVREAGAGGLVAGDRLGVAAKTVVLRVGGEAGAHAVQVDVGGHRFEPAAPPPRPESPPA